MSNSNGKRITCAKKRDAVTNIKAFAQTAEASRACAC